MTHRLGTIENAVYIFGIAGILAFFIYDKYYLAPWYQQIAKENGLLFDTTEINGRIKYFKQEISNADAFVLSNDPTKLFITTVRFQGDDRGKDFDWIAKPGDSIIKHRYSDSLILVTKDKIYHCWCYRGNYH